MEKSPSPEALKEWMKVSTREGALRWHLKWTPWFSALESAKIVNLYDAEKFKTKIDLDNLSDTFSKMLLTKKIEQTIV